MNRTKILFLLAIIIGLVSCNEQTEIPEDQDEVLEVVTDGSFKMSKEQLAYASIEYGSFEKQMLSDDVQARGELVLPVNAKANMVCLFPGSILKINVNEGDQVSIGQSLAVINSTAFIEAQQRYLMVKNQISMLQQEYERQKELNKEKISSDKYYQKSLADYNVAQAEIQGLSLQLKMAGVDFEKLDAGVITSELSIRTTLKGYVENINANPGKYINPDESIFQVINRNNLLIELNVFEKDILKVKAGQRITFSLGNMSQVIHEAEIISVGNTVQEEARVVKVLASFNNKGGRLLPGMFVSSEIHTGENEVNALPNDAILRMGNDEYIIFYTTPGMQFEDGTEFISVPVQMGNSEDGFAEITPLSMIPEDAIIVVKGGYYLKTEKARQEE